MKKTASLILCIVLVLGLSVSALASTVGVSASKAAVKKGESVDVSITLSDDMNDITNFEYSLYFDAANFELQSSEIGSACAATQLSKCKTDAKGSYSSVSFVDTTSEGAKIAKGTICTLTFKAIRDITESSVSGFSLVQISVMNNRFEQVADASVGTASVSVSLTPPAVGYSDIYFTIAAPANVEAGVGRSFNAVIYSTQWDAKGYKLLDCLVNIPTGLEVTSVTAGDRLTGGSVSYHSDSAGKLRIVYNDPNTLSDLTLTGTDFPAPVFSVGLKTTSALTSEAVTLSLGGASLKVSSDSEAEDSLNIMKLPATADEQGNTGKASVSFVTPGSVAITAAELFIGDGVDLIAADKKAIVVSVTGIGSENIKMTYRKGSTTTEMLYSAEISAVTGNLCYVAVVGSGETVSDYASYANYTLDKTAKANTVLFGDTNGDYLVNAQDALNVIQAWTRKNTLSSEEDYLTYNVNADSRINTYDAIGVEEGFVNASAFKIITRAAALTSGK